jgi:hypothetical protein
MDAYTVKGRSLEGGKSEKMTIQCTLLLPDSLVAVGVVERKVVRDVDLASIHTGVS